MKIDSNNLNRITRDGDTHAAAQQLEAYFLRQVLAEVRKSTSSGLVDGGFAGETFHEMLDEALADSMAGAGGMGLAKKLEQQMGKSDLGDNQSVPVDEPGTRPAALAPAGLPSSTGGAAPLSVRPVDGEVRSPMGARVDPIEGDQRFHAGLDLAGAVGTPVRAAGAGVVTRAERAGGYGNLVVMQHGGGLETRYGHLSRIDVHVGEKVPAGAEIGEVGATGRVTGPHLHLEVRRNGRPIDPVMEIPPLKDSK